MKKIKILFLITFTFIIFKETNLLSMEKTNLNNNEIIINIDPIKKRQKTSIFKCISDSITAWHNYIHKNYIIPCIMFSDIYSKSCSNIGFAKIAPVDNNEIIITFDGKNK
ncbi:MAG: hypothetical protein UR12_C0013G0028 [candidate division TM6 bacterium GW2011_GWF2_30_66]|jgi:hypothetical protein|nr:MAG: hypothetical protein UR12_C0013G0028 [candidate division TM6 bacterium GW2011_GWF2_30_66]